MDKQEDVAFSKRSSNCTNTGIVKVVLKVITIVDTIDSTMESSPILTMISRTMQR